MSKVPSFRWPLAVSTHTLADKLGISWWLLTQNRFTMGKKVEAFENAMSDFSGMKALMVSSGSTANQLVFELWKMKNPGITPVVIVPACTWISSISPAMMAGMEISFCDINLNDFSFDYDHLVNLLDTHKRNGRRVIIWPTALIGYCPDMDRMKGLAESYNADLYLDSCENTFSRRDDGSSILASASITTTSCYYSHQITSVEAGFIFFKEQSDYDLAKMFRNHGMTRSLSSDHYVRKYMEETNPDIDPAFLFAIPGTNLRPTDVHAMFGLADMERVKTARAHRVATFEQYHMELDMGRYYLPERTSCHVGFCLPIFSREGAGPELSVIKAALAEEGVEVRPIIGGHLGYQPCLKRLFEKPIAVHYPNAEWIHRRGCYVGLHSKVTSRMITKLTSLLNSL